MGNTEKERSPRFSCRPRDRLIWNGGKIRRPIRLPRGFFPTRRTILFENLCTLQEAMIGNPGYLELGVDFPNFDLSATELEWYGIFPFYKARQIALLSATHSRRWKFGGGLLRYNPELGEAERYVFADISLEGLPTCPNTPESLEEPEKVGSDAAPVQVLGVLRDGF
ncbi:hypothetical protein B0H13DRAFT_1914214 [Mycena leptocephala]|nr:hypothetical protein B0H13DRAFT_1914214 [Mycena leptocephala]